MANFENITNSAKSNKLYEIHISGWAGAKVGNGDETRTATVAAVSAVAALEAYAGEPAFKVLSARPFFDDMAEMEMRRPDGETNTYIAFPAAFKRESVLAV